MFGWMLEEICRRSRDRRRQVRECLEGSHGGGRTRLGGNLGNAHSIMRWPTPPASGPIWPGSGAGDGTI
jgi:hypothetical protein